MVHSVIMERSIPLQAMIQFWKIKLWNWKGVVDQMENWYDGFSTFYVGGDGLVYRHVADSVSFLLYFSQCNGYFIIISFEKKIIIVIIIGVVLVVV